MCAKTSAASAGCCVKSLSRLTSSPPWPPSKTAPKTVPMPMMSVPRCACRTVGATSVVVRRSNAQAVTDRADRSTVIALPVRAHPQGAMAATTAAVAHPVRPATDHLWIAAPAPTAPAQTDHRATDHHRQIGRKGIVGRRVETARMCPIDRCNRHNRRVRVANYAKSAVPAIRAPTALAPAAIDRRVIDHKGIDHCDRAEIGRSCAQSSVIVSHQSD